jgi:hypothetical protein
MIIRWYCAECGRVDVRHPHTKVEEMPEFHTRPESMGFMWSDNLCGGERIPQRFENNEWVLDEIPSKSS